MQRPNVSYSQFLILGFLDNMRMKPSLAVLVRFLSCPSFIPEDIHYVNYQLYQDDGAQSYRGAMSL